MIIPTRFFATLAKKLIEKREMHASETVEFVLFIIFVIVGFAALLSMCYMCKNGDILKDPSETDGEFNCKASEN